MSIVASCRAAPSSRPSPGPICGVSPTVEADFHGCEAMADEASCKRAGGDWKTVEVENNNMAFKCVCPLLDIGCPCATSKECEDACLIPKVNGCVPPADGAPVRGACGRLAGTADCFLDEHGKVVLGTSTY
jgi:hypothetical protein